MQVKRLFRCCNSFPERNVGGDKEATMIVYKMVTREQDGRLVSLMEKGKRQMEYRPGEVTYRSYLPFRFSLPRRLNFLPNSF